MKIFSIQLLQNKIFRGSVIFFIGGITANILNYFYRVIMGRMLGPELFGELIAVLSLIFILAVPSAPIQTAVARFSAIYYAHNSTLKIREFLKYITKLAGAVGIVLIILIVIFARPIQNFLNLSSVHYIYFLAGIVAVMLISGAAKGVLQGLKRFPRLSAGIVIESAGKLGLAVLLVAGRFAIAGALSGLFIALLLAYILILYFLKDILENVKLKEQNAKPIQKTKIIEIKQIWKYMFWSLLTFFFLNILLNVDIILVKHYFLDFDAGIYSSFATLGRIVFLVISLLGGIIFPLVAFKQAKKEYYFYYLKMAVVAALLMAGFIIFVFFVFAYEFILLFLGGDYLGGVPFLGYYGLVMVLMGFIFVLTYFLMALNKFSSLYFLAGGSILEILFITLWHQNFSQVISMFFIAAALTLIGLIFLIFLQKKKTAIIH